MANKIYQLIPKIMSEVGAIEKTRRPAAGAGVSYAFRGIDDIYFVLQPLLHANGVFFVPTVLKVDREERKSNSGGTLNYTILQIKYTFFADDGSFVEAVTVGEAMDTSDKSSNKAMSAALKYAVLQVFCIPTHEDNDTENANHEMKPRQTAPAPPIPAPKVAPLPTPQPTSENLAAVKPKQVVGTKELKDLVDLVLNKSRSNLWTNAQVAAYMEAKYKKEKLSELTLLEFRALYATVKELTVSAAMDQVKGFVQGDLPPAASFPEPEMFR